MFTLQAFNCFQGKSGCSLAHKKSHLGENFPEPTSRTLSIYNSPLSTDTFDQGQQIFSKASVEMIPEFFF